jgi:hypothetical protein
MRSTPGAYTRVEHLGMLQPCLQTLDYAGKAYQRQTLQLINKSGNLRP